MTVRHNQNDCGYLGLFLSNFGDPTKMMCKHVCAHGESPSLTLFFIHDIIYLFFFHSVTDADFDFPCAQTESLGDCETYIR